jgi:DNA polymerase III epsilon subunit-like protein
MNLWLVVAPSSPFNVVRSGRFHACEAILAPMSIGPSNIFPDEHSADCSPLFESANFFALDVETANAGFSSICQIAVVRFEFGRAVDIWHSFLNPGEPFAALNVAIHGITEGAVYHAPEPKEVMRTVSAMLGGQVVASHMPFDRIALQATFSKYQIPHVESSWLDTAVIARRAWPRFARKGYGLKSLAAWCDIEFRHHDAVEDAITAGRILSKAIADTGRSVEHWLHDSAVRKLDKGRMGAAKALQRSTRRRSSLRYAASDPRQFSPQRCPTEQGA